MKKLYQPIKLRGLELKNRVVMAPMSLENLDHGYPTDRDVEFYRQHARGGVAAIIFANMQWDHVRFNEYSGAIINDDKYIPSLKKITDVVHEEGAAMFAQLLHQGRYGSKAYWNGNQTVSASAVPSRYNGFEMPRALTVDEIHDFVKWQGEAAARAMKAGFDGIEIETNTGYLHGQFFSPLVNQRSDEYGGDVYGRTRFMRETLQSVRDAIGPDVPISVRICGNDLVPGSCNSEDLQEICRILDETGNVDILSVTAGWHESSVPLITMELPNGTWSYLGRGIKKKVKCNVMQGIRMNIPTGEEMVERGDADLIVIGRPLLADPELVNKAKSGHLEDARPCMGCNAGCLDACMQGRQAGCVGNAECNQEIFLVDDQGRLPTQVKSEHPEKILVIGAGPAGMEFARVATLRGHDVTIWEARDRTKGLSMLAATPPRRYDIRYLGQWLEHICRKQGVNFVFNKRASAEDILAVANGYDRVVIATGSVNFVPGFDIEEGADVVTAWDVLEKNAPLGKNVTVIGGGATGVETAMYIAEMGTPTAEQLRFMMIYDVEPYEKLKELLNTGSKKVTVLEMSGKFATDITPGCRWSIIKRNKMLGVKMINKAKVTAVRKDGVVYKSAGKELFVKADTVVMAAGARPSNELYEALQGKLEKVHVIGDANNVGKIPDAIQAAYSLAKDI